MNGLIEMHVRYRGDERFLRLAKHQGEWTAALLVPGKIDSSGESPPYAPRGALLPAADFDDMTFKIEAPAGTVVSLNTMKLIASGGVAVRNGWIEVPLLAIIRDYRDAEGDQLPAPPRAEILTFPPPKARDIEMEL